MPRFFVIFFSPSAAILVYQKQVRQFLDFSVSLPNTLY